MRNDPSVVVKTYDFVLWLLPHLAGFSRQHRFTLGDRMENQALEILDLLVQASYSREKRDLLRQANLGLERLRFLIRLAKDLRLLSGSQYEFAGRAMYGIGSEIGGWTKQAASPPPS